VQWLAGADLADTTRSFYAAALGIPAAARTWRSGTRRSVAVEVPQAFLRWCEANGVDPFRDVDLERLRKWVRFAREAGDTEQRLRGRIAAVAQWYGAMARRGLTTTTFEALMTRAERRALASGDTTTGPDGPDDRGEGDHDDQ
jgi:hypothetical protein